jgi:hypothetical protein
MGRTPTYATAAERQRAYRARRAARLAGNTPSLPGARPPYRLPSRPRRLGALEESLRRLHHEYQAWLESIPESLQDGDQAQRVRETMEQIESAAESLADIVPPRGFGRD